MSFICAAFARAMTDVADDSAVESLAPDNARVMTFGCDADKLVFSFAKSAGERDWVGGNAVEGCVRGTASVGLNSDIAFGWEVDGTT
jgi:hypothetical protein